LVLVAIMPPLPVLCSKALVGSSHLLGGWGSGQGRGQG
jgi:hypothetical protein